MRHARDEGTDLHELRELRPGDPYRRIAWKTSARLGRLVVRELEREELGSLDIVLDASASMREGVPGHRRIDRAVALALGVAEDALARGERVGFVAVDRRVLVRVPRAAAADQRERIADALVTALSCVDADRTVEDDADVARSVARYVRFQEGADFLDPSVRDGVHVERLALHVASRAKGHHEVTGPTSASRILRRYADLMAIPLTPRSDRDPDARNAALSAALAPLAGRRSAPAKLVVITDGVDVDFEVRLRPTLTRLRTHGHVVEVLLVPKRLPGAHDLGLDEDSPIVTAYVEDDLARLKALTLRLRARGVTSSVDWRGGRTRSVA